MKTHVHLFILILRDGVEKNLGCYLKTKYLHFFFWGISSGVIILKMVQIFHKGFYNK